MSLRVVLLMAGLMLAPAVLALASSTPIIAPKIVQATVARLVDRHGDARAERIRRGVSQVAERWWPEDGDAEVFGAFCDEHFLADPASLSKTFSRIEKVMGAGGRAPP